MSRPNRVDPWGDLHAVPSRGLFTGNRGCLVDDKGIIRRHHAGSLWIVCRLTYGDLKQPLSSPRTWTPLFFLDDAVALAAGHRPCGFCRRADHRSYRDGVAAGTASIRPILAAELNRRLAGERLRRGRGLLREPDRIVWKSRLDDLPPGAVILHPGSGEPHLVTGFYLQPFGFDGWGSPVEQARGSEVEVLTPPTSVQAIRGGFAPRLHPTAVSIAMGW